MKKLQKRVLFSKDTVEAFACPCGCSCPCLVIDKYDGKSEDAAYTKLENMYDEIEP